MKTQELAASSAPAKAGRDRARRPRLAAAIWADAIPASLDAAAIHSQQLVDLFWLGRLGPEAIAAAGLGVSLRWAFASLAMGLGVGSMSLVARHRARYDYKALGVAGWQATLLSLAVTAALVAAGLLCAAPLLQLLGADGEVLSLALSYLRLSLLGLLPQVLLLNIGALWRGLGAETTAREVLWLASVVGIALDPLLVSGLGQWRGLGMAGAPLAGACGALVGLAVQAILLRRGYAGLRLSRSTFGLSLPVLRHILLTSAPSSLQLAMRSTARVVLAGIMARRGSMVLAGFAVANSILVLALVPTLGLGSAAATGVMRNLARGHPARAARDAWVVGALNAGYVTAVLLAAYALGPRAIAAFSAAPAVLDHGADVLRIVTLGYASSALGVLRARSADAAGHSAPTAWTNLLILWGIEIPLALLLGRAIGVSGIWLGLAFGGVVNGLLVSYRGGGRQPALTAR